MTGYEEQLYARAEMLEETGELAAAVTEILARRVRRGRRPARRHQPAQRRPGARPGGRPARLPGGQQHRPAPGHRVRVRRRVPRGGSLTPRTAVTGRRARRGPAPGAGHRRARRGPSDDLEPRPRDLHAARQTWPPRTPCPPGTRATAATAPRPQRSRPPRPPSPTPRAASADADRAHRPLRGHRRDPRPARRAARRSPSHALRQVPHDLGEVYELVYDFIRRGGKMPRYGRWIEGAPA